MTDGGKFIGITGILSVGLCVGGAGFFLVQEFIARSSLPLEMQTPEMIQRYYDGEVVLFSITFAMVLLVCAFVLTFFFGSCFALYETRYGKNSKTIAAG